MPAAATEPGAGLLAKLAATPPTAAAVTGGGVGGGLLAGSTMKILVAAVGVAGIAVGAFLVAPLMDPKEPAPSAGRADSIPAVALPPRAVGHDTQAISPPADLRDPVASPDAHVGRSAAVAKSARKGMEQRRPAVEQPSQRNGAELLDEQLREKPTVFRNDTVKMKVRRGSHAQ